MSTEDKANEISSEAQDQKTTPPTTDPAALQSGDGAPGPITLFFILGLVASLVIGWVIFPQLLYSSKEQPLQFNHVLHNELVDDGCESCHFFRQDGTFSGAPMLQQRLKNLVGIIRRCNGRKQISGRGIHRRSSHCSM